MSGEKAKICPKCKSKMEEGIVPDRSEDWQKYNLQWGKKVTRFGFGLKDAIDIVAYKCATCGYIELYSKKK